MSYLGPPGTFTEEAAERFSKEELGGSGELQPARTITAVFSRVERGEADYGVVPWENSLEGSVGETLDNFLRREVRVFGELVLPIVHALMSGSESNDREPVVYSHPQAYEQAREALRELLGDHEFVPTASTAEAAKLASEKGAYALGPPRLAERFELDVVEEVKLENNETRFAIISRRDRAPTKEDKTSVVFSVTDRPGALREVLGIFADRGINLTKIESRPAKSGLGDYVFFLDFEGHRMLYPGSEALAELRERTPFSKVLGSYPKAFP
ncbi:prephenate dehydratase [Methanopyrus sp.]